MGNYKMIDLFVHKSYFTSYNNKSIIVALRNASYPFYFPNLSLQSDLEIFDIPIQKRPAGYYIL